jgi:hypothetical protein
MGEGLASVSWEQRKRRVTHEYSQEVELSRGSAVSDGCHEKVARLPHTKISLVEELRVGNASSGAGWASMSRVYLLALNQPATGLHSRCHDDCMSGCRTEIVKVMGKKEARERIENESEREKERVTISVSKLTTTLIAFSLPLPPCLACQTALP